jgi:beta-glucosidase
MPPGEFSPLKASFACQNLLRAHVSAYDRIHRSGLTRKGPWKECPVEVGIAHNMMDFFPDRVWHPLEQALARVLRRFYNQSWLDAVTGRKQNFGIRGMLPYAPVVPEALRRKTVDFIGLNYYTKAYVQWRPKSSMTAPFEGIPVGVEFARRGEEVSDLGWAIHPEGLRKMIRKVARYRLPIYITENGIADRDDRHRTEYLRSHLNEVKKAIENGVDLRGYYYWSLLDNFEWSKGFAPRFGLYHVDYDTLERRETSSCRFFSDWIENSRSI